MLQKPRRWPAYTIELNDLLPNYEEIIDRFERSDVPLDGVFGSSSVSTAPPLGILVAVGPAVEPQRLDEVIRLVEDLDLLLLVVHDDPSHNKVIIIGAMNLESAPFVAVAVLDDWSGTEIGYPLTLPNVAKARHSRASGVPTLS